MSDGASVPSEHPHGLDLLPRDLTADELVAAPVLDSLDVLLLDLTDDEDDAFAAAPSDLWVASTALHIGAPLVTADRVFEGVPGLVLHPGPSA